MLTFMFCCESTDDESPTQAQPADTGVLDFQRHLPGLGPQALSGHPTELQGIPEWTVLAGMACVA